MAVEGYVNSLLSGFFTFMVAGFFERGQATLEPFFTWHPWLYLFLVPAVGMRMWSEERRLGTIEEFGAACAFLCSVHAGYITGQNLLMDGGAYPGTF